MMKFPPVKPSLVVAAVVTTALALTPSAGASALAKRVSVGKFTSPIEVVQVPGTGSSRVLWVVQKRGTIAVNVDGVTKSTTALNIGSLISFGDEQGLLSVAFAPDFATSHRAYVTYTDKANAVVLSEYTGTATELEASSRRVVMTLAKTEDDHNAGTIHFGRDGYLYMSVGDGGGPGDRHGLIGNAQDRSNLLGKILRIDPRQSGSNPYTVPATNPFSLIAGPAVRSEIWAYGLRNPWKWSFAPDGALWVGDVGQDTHEEIDRLAVGGLNLGWRIMEGVRLREGTTAPGGLTAPTVDYKHSAANGCAVIGGVTVTDKSLTKLYGRYLHGDFCRGTLFSLSWTSKGVSGNASTGITACNGMLTSIDAGLDGRVYLSCLDGSVWRLSA